MRSYTALLQSSVHDQPHKQNPAECPVLPLYLDTVQALHSGRSHSYSQACMTRRCGDEQGRLVAMDIHKKRLGALKTAAAAQGLQDLISTRTGDLCQYADWVASQQEEERREHQYDRVLVDAPCSGLGVLAKR